MDELYRDAMKERVLGLKEEIEDILTELVKNPAPSIMVYRSAERSLQLLTEACIGIAKRTLKAEEKQVPSDARQVFSKLKSLGLDSTDADWNRIIGMRNAFVHDYLNIDPDRVLDVIRLKHYQVLLDFAAERLVYVV
jgi:uncharacterized protein YutE (UPF0331/DUF86 family)